MLRVGSVISAITFLVAGGSGYAADQYPKSIPARNGEVILHEAWTKQLHDHGVAAMRRAGNTLYLGGQIVYRAEGEGNDTAALKKQSRRTLEQFKAMLEAAGATFQDVVLINSFHVWQGPNFSGTEIEQFRAFSEALREFMQPPYAAWTAVGTSGLLDPRGIIEVQLIARIPSR